MSVSAKFDVYSTHPDVIQVFRSEYVSPSLTDADRQWAESMIEESHRTKYYDLTPEQCEIISEVTAENYVQGLAKLTFAYARDRVGLVLCEKQKAEKIDEETGEVLTDDEGNNIGPTIIPDHDFGVTVKQAGLVDCNGVAIPTGYQYFKVIHQSGNRPRTESNYVALKRRMLKWMLNGEQLIKDILGEGITEQHRGIARCLLSLEGVKVPGQKEPQAWPPEKGPLVFFTDGIHPLAAITADTGKSNSGKDIFASDPELLPVDHLLSPETLTGNTEEPVYLTDRVGARTKALGKCESAMKLILARMAGKNVNAGIGNANEATELAHRAIHDLLPDVDTLAGYCYILQCPRFERTSTGGKVVKVQPVSPNDICAALVLYALKDAEPVNVLGTANHPGVAFDDASAVRFDPKQFIPLLEDMFNADGTGQSGVKEWLRARTSKYSNLSKADKFAQLLRMIVAYFGDEEVGEELLPKTNYNAGKGKFYHVGGADIGVIGKKKKEDEGDDEEA